MIGDGGFSTNPSVVATAMEANLPVVWLVMDNAGFGTIAGLEATHCGWDFACIRSADELGPALREVLASNLPTVIQASMENAPTPTPGRWNIMDFYRNGD